jgi:hypothetical protein
MVRFAGDMAVVAGSEEDMKNSQITIGNVFQESNMKTKKKISEILVCGREKAAADDIMKRERLNKWNHSLALEEPFHGMGEAHE